MDGIWQFLEQVNPFGGLPILGSAAGVRIPETVQRWRRPDSRSVTTRQGAAVRSPDQVEDKPAKFSLGQAGGHRRVRRIGYRAHRVGGMGMV